MNALIRTFGAAALLAFGMANAWSQEMATPAESQARLKQIVAASRAQGADKVASEIMATDPYKCKYKDMACIVMNRGGKIIANPTNPVMVGQVFAPDFTDIDGVPIQKQVLQPYLDGKLTWEAKYKFSRGGTKIIVPRWSTCEKIDAEYFACTIISPQ